MRKGNRVLAVLMAVLLLAGNLYAADGTEAKAKIQLNKKKISLRVGKTYKLKVKGTKKKVKWTSSNKKVATVSKKGVVKAVKKGTARITAKVAKKKLHCKVTVLKKKQKIDPPLNITDPTPAPPTELTVAFSRESGSYEDEFVLLMSAPEGATIYYTTDGSIPQSKEERAKTGIKFPAKLDTKKYSGKVEIRNRDSQKNQLWTTANRKYMYLPSEYFDGISGSANPSVAIPKATVIRAVAVAKDGTRSDVVTKTYFVKKNLKTKYKGASVISVVTDPDNLLRKKTGIYRYGNWENSGKEWERPADVTYIEEDGSIPFETRMGLRIHGGYSRRWGQKSLRLYFREELGGLKNLKGYTLIPDSRNHDGTAAIEKYKNFILRNGGNDYKYTKMADVWIQSLVEDRAYATQDSRPTVVYLNGEYWGLYNLTERYSDTYIETEFGVNNKNVISFKEGEWKEGQDEEADTAKYNELMALAKLDMTKTENYEKFKQMVDLQSFLDYFATEAYIGNKDWPYEDGSKNVQIWRANEVEEGNPYADGKWRYMLYDTEFSMNLWDSDSSIGNAVEWAKRDALFKAVSANKEFQKAFAATVVDLADHNFEPAKAEKKWNELEAVYRPLMKQYFDRWGKNYGGFDAGTDRIAYLKKRKSKMLGYLKSSFGNDVLS